MTKTCAVVIRGDSFRLGNQGNQNCGNPASINDQLAAAQSHVKLCNYLCKIGYEPHIYLTTVATHFTNKLLEIYKPFLNHKNILTQPLPSQGGAIHTAVNAVDPKKYDCIMIVRVDIELYDKFIESVTIDDCITFVSVCWYKCRKTPKSNPRINDTFYQFPRKQFGILELVQKSPHIYGHNFLDYVTYSTSNIRFMTPYYYDSDSFKDYNPYYRIVNREVSSIIHSGSYRYPEDF
jgi:hypothetical protein